MTQPLHSDLARDRGGVLHVVALSGGKDSTALALLLNEREPRPYTYVCTPTGNELPEMIAHWLALGERLGSRVLPVMSAKRPGLIASIELEKMIPNSRARWCTRKLKLEPYFEWLSAQAAQGPVVSYVGLRADEEGRAGGTFDHPAVTVRFPLREWGMGEAAVWAALEQRNVSIPERTDCALCYHQRLGEWWVLWRDHPEHYAEGERLEERWGHTFRSASRDTWPARLADLRVRFEAGEVPTARNDPRVRDLFRSGTCRACSL